MLNFLHLVISPPESSVLYVGSYDPVLVSLSIIVAIFASYASLLVSQHVSTARTAAIRRMWTVAGGLCLGAGIWAMHFVGMLAFSLPCSSSYDVAATLLSTIPGILASTLALRMISRREPSHAQLVMGGLLIGVGIGAMHYSGMAAMRLDGLIRYDVKLFLLSIFVAIALAMLALWIRFRLQPWQARWKTGVTAASAVVMGLAVSGMHYTAMAAAYFIRGGDATAATPGIAPAFLAAIVLAATGLIIIVTIVATYIERPDLSSFRHSYKLVGLLVAGWWIIAWLSADYYYSRFADNAYQRELRLAGQQAEQVAGNIDRNIERLKGVSQVFSRDEGVLRALRRSGAGVAPSTLAYEERKQRWTQDKMLGGLNDSLRIAATHLGTDNIFIINAAGDCIAAGNAGKSGSSVGANFADRAYFPQVQAGQQGSQYAVGRTTNVPGLFYAYPVVEAGRFLGAVIVKRDIANFAFWTNQANAFIADANGVIVLAPDKQLELRSLPNSAAAKLPAEKILLQYKRNTLESLEITPLGDARFPAAVFVEGKDSPLVLASKGLPEGAITIYVPRPLDELVHLGNERYLIFLLLAAAGSMLIIAVSAVVLYLRESHRTAADLRIAATAFESQDSMVITDAGGVILRVNQAFTETTGYTAKEALGQTLHLLKSGRHDAEFYRAMWETLLRTGTWQGEIWDRRKNGEIYPAWLTISAVKGGDGAVTHYVGSHIDITERKARAEEIRNLAFYDPLTHLPNRRLLLDRLRQALGSSARSRLGGALLFIDLDNFKTLNDTLGHDIGDLLLQQVAQRLKSCVREGDTVARLGGDEFVVMLEGLSEQAHEAAAQTEAVGEKILATLNQTYQLAAHEYRSTPSIGATLFAGQQQTIEELLKQADITMYQAKKAGRNALRFFDPQMQATINANAALKSELLKAIEQQQLRLYYQVQVDNAHRPLGAEALIRWVHPERGLVPPDQFIALAEESGLMLPIGQWVLETACAQISAWQQDVLTRGLVLAVNVSAKQFRQADFVARVQAAVQRHGINPMLLKLELTESLLLENIESTIATMTALSGIGVRFSLDDFGTGYSFLQYLKRLPLDQLKIDKLFIRGIATDRSDNAVVHAIIALAQNLKMDVIAEGVETEEQRQFLLDKGCIHYQGHLFGKPVPIEQFEAMLRQGSGLS